MTEGEAKYRELLKRYDRLECAALFLGTLVILREIANIAVGG